MKLDPISVSMWGIGAVLVIGFWGTVGVVAYHFIEKFW